MNFVRAFPAVRPGCRLGKVFNNNTNHPNFNRVFLKKGSRVPFNTLTGVLDGNTVYGVTEKFAR